MTGISANFSFLADHDLQLTRLAALAERYFADDPNTCLIKPRQFGELIVYPDKLIRVRLDEHKALPAFVALVGASSQARQQLRPHIKTAAGQHGISGKDLQSLQLPLPPLSTQHRIINRAQTAFQRLETLAAEHDRAQTFVPKLDQAILAKTFRGELVAQDPNDG